MRGLLAPQRGEPSLQINDVATQIGARGERVRVLILKRCEHSPIGAKRVRGSAQDRIVHIKLAA
jgi:hypothetical protein